MPFLMTAFDFCRVPTGCCPKCLELKRTPAPSCAKCGVLFEKVNLMSLAPPQWLLDDWLALCRDWHSSQSHDAVRDRAFEANEIQPLTRMYRLHLIQNPKDAPAQTALLSIARAGTAMVMAAAYQATQRKQASSSADDGWKKPVRTFLRLLGVPLR